MINRVLLLLFSLSVLIFYAQEKRVDTVYIFDKQIDDVKQNQLVKTLNQDDIKKNSTNLSELLRFQSEVYIKENGRGMVSSPSFRGTTAQQTAFIWNGINLNSIFLGQGDINNLSLLSYDNIEIIAGGGSVIYGSGAIGGSIHLNNQLTYHRGTHANLFLEGGSFKTYNSILKASHSTDRWSFSAGINHSSSDNDYEVSERKYRNENGNYKNIGANVGVGFKLNSRHQFSGFYHWDNGEQFFPILEATQTKTKYKTRNQRLLTAWDYHYHRIKNNFNFAFLNEEFDYFSSIDYPKSSGGVGKSLLLKNDFTFKINPKLYFNFITQYKLDKGEGYQSGIDVDERNSGYITSVLKFTPTNKFGLDIGLKKEFIDTENAPFLYALSGRYQPVKWYEVKFNFSKNYRAPTFNDLYWNPGGNKDLKSEIALQGSMDHLFTIHDFLVKLSPYYIRINNMIQWLPTANEYWSPINTNEVESYGVESGIDWKKKWKDWNFQLGVGYGYTHSTNLETKKQLAYVPIHKANLNGHLAYKNWSIYMQGLYNGQTFTTTDESIKMALADYFVLNMGVNANLFQSMDIGFKINNITDAIYETKAYYPLPKRNYSLYIHLNL